MTCAFVLLSTWAWRCSSLSTPPWRAMGPRLLLCCVAAVQVGSCWVDCQSIRVTLLVHVDVTSRSWMRAVVCQVYWVRRWPLWSTPSVALTAQQGVHARFTGRLVIVTRATVSTSVLIYTAAGDWAWMRRCRSSTKLLRAAASPHYPVVCTAWWYCTFFGVFRSSLPRFMWLGPTLVSLLVKRAVMWLVVYGR